MVSLVDPRAATAPSPSATKNSTASKTRRKERGSITLALSAPCQRAHAEEKPEQRDTDEKAGVREKDRACGKRRKMHQQREIDDQCVERIRQHPAEMVDDPQQQEEAEGQQSGDDLIADEARRHQADRNQRGAEQQQAEIAAPDRPPVGLTEDAQRDGVGSGQDQHQHHETEARQIFCEYDSRFRDWRGEQYLDRAQATLLSYETHRNDWHGQQEQYVDLKE